MDGYAFLRKYERGEPLTTDDLADGIEALFDAIDDFIALLDKESHMGAFDDIPNIVIPDPDQPEAAASFRKEWNWEAHEQVLIRGVYTGVEQEQVDNSSTVLSREGKKQKINVRVGTARNKLLEVMIVDWTLSQRGMKVPVNAASIARLPANYRVPILQQVDEIARVMSQDEQDDFLLSANGHSADTSETMNLFPNP